MPEPRLLFLLSNDYGELSSALHFLHGTELKATLLLPDRLFDANQGTLDSPARRYRTLEDVIESVESQTPDVVFLFSGYLYAVNRIFDLPTVAALLAELERRRVRVVTSDPFLGLLSAPDASHFSKQHPAHRALTEHFLQLAALLRNVTHLYHVPPGTFAGERKASFFNPHVIEGAGAEQHRRERLSKQASLDFARRRWLFVLASEDYGAQILRQGRDRFEALLLERLHDAARAGRQPVLIGPQPCVESLAGAAAGIPGLVLLSFCGHALFTDLLLEAEYVFYWNLVSNSLLTRMANRMPAFFFDRGHLAYAMPRVLELGTTAYLPGVQLALLDQAEKLLPDQLAATAAAQDHTLTGAIENLRGSPAPAELVAILLREPPRAGEAAAG